MIKLLSHFGTEIDVQKENVWIFICRLKLCSSLFKGHRSEYPERGWGSTEDRILRKKI